VLGSFNWCREFTRIFEWMQQLESFKLFFAGFDFGTVYFTTSMTEYLAGFSWT